MNFLRCLALRKKKLDDSLLLDVVEIARVPDILPSLFPSWSGKDLSEPHNIPINTDKQCEIAVVTTSSFRTLGSVK